MLSEKGNLGNKVKGQEDKESSSDLIKIHLSGPSDPEIERLRRYEIEHPVDDDGTAELYVRFVREFGDWQHTSVHDENHCAIGLRIQSLFSRLSMIPLIFCSPFHTFCKAHLQPLPQPQDCYLSDGTDAQTMAGQATLQVVVLDVFLGESRGHMSTFEIRVVRGLPPNPFSLLPT